MPTKKKTTKKTAKKTAKRTSMLRPARATGRSLKVSPSDPRYAAAVEELGESIHEVSAKIARIKSLYAGKYQREAYTILRTARDRLKDMLYGG
jgi:hypothetical protein